MIASPVLVPANFPSHCPCITAPRLPNRYYRGGSFWGDAGVVPSTLTRRPCTQYLRTAVGTNTGISPGIGNCPMRRPPGTPRCLFCHATSVLPRPTVWRTSNPRTADGPGTAACCPPPDYALPEKPPTWSRLQTQHGFPRPCETHRECDLQLPAL